MIAVRLFDFPTADNGWKNCQPQTIRAQHESEAITQMIWDCPTPQPPSRSPLQRATFHHRGVFVDEIGSNTSFTILHEFLITSTFYVRRQC
jgi:hypothetical protein